MRYFYVVQKQKGVADAMIKAWFYIRTEKLWYRANCLLFSGLAELSILNTHFAPTKSGGVNICFSSPVSVENNYCNGFSFTSYFPLKWVPKVMCNPRATSTLNDHQLKAGGFKSFRR